MKKFFLIIVLFLNIVQLSAQDDVEKQVLVFRNTGEVNLIYEEELDSIVTRTSGDMAEQLFFARDTVIAVPLAEIDSVAFGQRNVVEFRPDVRQLSVGLMNYLIAYEFPNLYFRKDTPVGLLPETGEKVFYGDRHELLPYGICGQVRSVTTGGTSVVVTLDEVELTDIFRRLFYAGPLTDRAQPKAVRPLSAGENVSGEVKFDQELELMENCKLKSLLNAEFEGRVVINLLCGYYHVDGTLRAESGFGIQFTCDESGELKYVTPDVAGLVLPPVLGVLYPSIHLAAFIDAKAEMNIDMDTKHSWEFLLDWTRNGKEDKFDYKPVETTKDGEDEVNIELILNGSVFTGGVVRVDLGLLGVLGGARFKVKLGPELKGELGMGLLSSLSRYDAEAYGKGSLTLTTKGQVEGCLFAMDGSEWKFLENSCNLGSARLNLFPEFAQTQGVRDITAPSEISVSTKTDTPLARPCDVGFELVDASGEVADSVFSSQPIPAHSENTQGVAADFSTSRLQQADMTGWTVRPVFHYANHLVRAAAVPLKEGALLEPIISLQSNGACTYVSGVPVAGQAVGDSTLYMVGPYLPIAACDTVFSEPSVPVVGIFLNEVKAEQLLGDWHAVIDGRDVTLTFADETSGSVAAATAYPFTYVLNTPQSGDVRLTFDQAGAFTYQFRVISLTAAELRVRTADGQFYSFSK